MRVLWLAVVALLAACGGGGTDSTPPAGPPAAPPTSPPSTPPVAQTYSISGVVRSFSGLPIPGVQVQLSGAAAASATSDAFGVFLFVAVRDGLYTVVPDAAAGPFTPVGTPVTVAGQSRAGLAFVQAPPAASMEAIAASFAVAHARARAGFNSAEVALSSQLSAEGAFFSGRHYTMSRSNFVAAVTTFTSDALSLLRLTATTATIDRAAVAVLLGAYATQDATFAASYYRAANWGLTGAALDGFVAETVAQTNAVYAEAAAQVP